MASLLKRSLLILGFVLVAAVAVQAVHTTARHDWDSASIESLVEQAIATDEARARGEVEAEVDMSNTVDASTMGFSMSLARRDAHYAGAAYCALSKPDLIKEWKCDACKNAPRITELTVFAATTARGFVGYDENRKQIMVAFSGTPGKSILTWLANLNAVPKPVPSLCSGCSAHSGFYNGYLSVRTPILEAVKALRGKYSSAKVELIGHSLGGAQSYIAMADFAAQGIPLAPIHHTYGSPRAGNPAFATHVTGLAGTTYRVVHNADLVPHVPPMFFKYIKLGGKRYSYRHPATEVFENKAGATTVCSAGDGEDKKCPRNKVPVSIKDHLMYLGVSFETHGCGYDGKALELLGEQLHLSKLWPGAPRGATGADMMEEITDKPAPPKSAFEKLKDKAGDLYNKGKDAVKTGVGKVKETGKKIVDGAKTVGQKVVNGTKSGLAKLREAGKVGLAKLTGKNKATPQMNNFVGPSNTSGKKPKTSKPKTPKTPKTPKAKTSSTKKPKTSSKTSKKPTHTSSKPKTDKPKKPKTNKSKKPKTGKKPETTDKPSENK